MGLYVNVIWWIIQTASLPSWSDSWEFRVTSSDLLAADQWAEGLPGVRHEGLDLVHAARHARQELHAVRRHGDVVLDAHLDHKQQKQTSTNVHNNRPVTCRSPDRPLDTNAISARGSWDVIKSANWYISHMRRLSHWLMYEEIHWPLTFEKRSNIFRIHCLCVWWCMRVYWCSTAACMWYSLSNTSTTTTHAILLTDIMHRSCLNNLMAANCNHVVRYSGLLDRLLNHCIYLSLIASILNNEKQTTIQIWLNLEGIRTALPIYGVRPHNITLVQRRGSVLIS